MPEKCLNCGSENLEPGQVLSPSPLTWLDDKHRNSLFRHNSGVRAWSCNLCGYVLLFRALSS